MPTPPKPLIYLASASPRRSALLAQIGVPHRVRPVDVDEQQLSGEAPRVYVTRLARTKAQTLWDQLGLPDRCTDELPHLTERLPVLGADTTVAIGLEILGKPRDRADGLSMLARLSGQTHQVFTAVALCHADGCDVRVSVSDVTFRALLPEEIAAYWESGEPADKAGGYAVQGLAAVFIQQLVGSYSGIMGLPLFETAELLDQIGWRMQIGSQATGDARVASAPPGRREARA